VQICGVGAEHRRSAAKASWRGLASKGHDSLPLSACSDLLEGAVDIPTVPQLNHYDHKFVVLDLVDDSISPLSDTVPIVAGKLLTTRRSGIRPQALNSPYEALSVLLSGNGQQFLLRRGFDSNPIASHCASIP
jgi:hypothetical protein